MLSSGSLLVEVGYLAEHVLDGGQQDCLEVFEDDFAETEAVFVGGGVRQMVHHRYLYIFQDQLPQINFLPFNYVLHNHNL